MISFLSLSKYFASAFTFYVGGGIGEAALIGAAFGGGKALVTGEDPLKAALLGTVTGAAMSGLTQGAMGLIGPNSAAAGGASAAGAAGANEMAIDSAKNMLTPTVAQVGSPALTTQAASTGITGLGEQGMSNTYNMLTGNPLQAPIPSQGIAGAAGNTANSMINNTATSGGLGGGTRTAEEIAKQTATPNDPFVDLKRMVDPTPGGIVDKGFDFAIDNPYLTAGGAGAVYGALSPPKMDDGENKDEEKSPLAGYDRDSFTPYEAPRPDPFPQAQYTDYFRGAKEGGVLRSYAQGGIANLAGGGSMAGQAYPQGLLPNNTEFVDGGYEPPVNTYTGARVGPGMAEGGVARFFPGGPTSNQVYYDAQRGEYYTSNNSSGFLRGVAGRNYIGGKSNKAAVGDVNPSVGNYKVARVENPYQARYSEPVAPREYTGPQGGVGRDYSLADSMPLLAATNPGIAAKYAASAPTSMAGGGIAGYNLGGYAAGGNPRLLKGPGDGMSDNIPATIGDRQPARLADGEFVVPADVVSHLGNGSTDAGAKHLYNMMDRVRKARTGNKKQGKQIKSSKFLPR